MIVSKILKDLGLAQRDVEKAIREAKKAGKAISPALTAEIVLKASVARELPTQSWRLLEAWALTEFPQRARGAVLDNTGR